MSRKVFTAGEVLAAADVNNFLMNQTVMSFAGTAARGSAIPTPVDGMTTYLEDTDDLQIWDGSRYASPFGLTFLARQTFTTTTSIIIDNVFTSVYDNYQIIINATAAAVPTETNLNLRGAGTNITTNYFDQFIQGATTNITAQQTSTTAVKIGRLDTTGGMVNLYLGSPALAQRTYGLSNSMDSSATIRQHGILNTNAISYDGFRITFGGNTTGQIRVYGIRN
jgi:hypothetical protein